MDGDAVESGAKRQKGPIYQPNFPVIFYTTGIVILAASILIPFWYKYDPLLQVLDNFRRSVISEDGQDGKTLMSKDELAAYDAKVSKGKIYLAILGKVFDVTVGKEHYGKGASYSFFTGRHIIGMMVVHIFLGILQWMLRILEVNSGSIPKGLCRNGSKDDPLIYSLGGDTIVFQTHTT